MSAKKGFTDSDSNLSYGDDTVNLSKNSHSDDDNPIDDASTNGQNRTTLTLPLINHHAMKRRRMLEMGLDENEMES